MSKLTDKDVSPSMRRLAEALALVAPELKTQADIARAVDESQGVVHNWGSRGVSERGALKAQVTYGINAAWILTGQGPKLINQEADTARRTGIEPPASAAASVQGEPVKVSHEALQGFVKGGLVRRLAVVRARDPEGDFRVVADMGACAAVLDEPEQDLATAVQRAFAIGMPSFEVCTTNSGHWAQLLADESPSLEPAVA